MSADPVSVDPNRYKVEFENDRVRVLRISYGPREKSAMHGHPEGVGIFLTDGQGRFTFPDGSTEEFRGKAGEAVWFETTEHLPENLSDQPLEVIFVELK
ncbi:MAG: cupin domain-containing protein [Acidobacteriota bacterium]